MNKQIHIVMGHVHFSRSDPIGAFESEADANAFIDACMEYDETRTFTGLNDARLWAEAHPAGGGQFDSYELVSLPISESEGGDE